MTVHVNVSTYDTWLTRIAARPGGRSADVHRGDHHPISGLASGRRVTTSLVITSATVRMLPPRGD